MWGADKGRSFFVKTEISKNLEPLWIRELGEPLHAWPFQFENYFTAGNPSKIGKIAFDLSYEPIAADGKIFVPSMKSDKITAYSAKEGKELWRFYADGPIRLAPVYGKGKLYFVSDDGCLYCLNGESGSLLWKYNGYFSEGRNLIGNERLVSKWAARGGPVLSDGILYFASGIFPFEGVFIHAVNAETGKTLWTNSTSGSMWSLHQHAGALAYGGISPQGYLAISEDKLIVAGGRTPPAVYHKTTGEFLYYRQAHGEVGKGAGGYMVSAWKGWFANHGMLYCLEDGAQYGAVPVSVVSPDSIIGVKNGSLISHSSILKKKDVAVKNRLGKEAIKVVYELQNLWEDKTIRNIKRLYFRAGQVLAVSLEGNRAALIELTADGEPKKIVWSYAIEGEIWNMLVSEGRLFIVTKEGKLYCFAEPTGTPCLTYSEETKTFPTTNPSIKKAEEILAHTGATNGYALFWGAGDGQLIQAILEKSSLHIIALEQNKTLVDTLRRRFDDAGEYGKRIVCIQADPLTFSLPPYMAELIVLTENEYTASHIHKAFYSLRPYSGALYLEKSASGFSDLFHSLKIPQGSLTVKKDCVIITRKGPLQGTGQWTHQYGDASQRAYSSDILVKPPLGLLWFGGTSNINALPRHHNGPIPQVVQGRLFILGMDTISARCVYTGRELWVKEIPAIGHPFTSLEHEALFRDNKEVYMPNHPGANFIGSPYVSMEDGIYVMNKNKILLLDPVTGETKKEFHLPFIKKIKRLEWGHILVWKDLLIATIDPQYFDDALPGKDKNWNATSSTLLLVMDRYNGKVLWAKQAERTGFRHNAIIAGNNTLYVIDGVSEKVVEFLQRRGVPIEPSSLLMAFNIRTGTLLWKRQENIFGTWLSYYEDRDILIQGGRRGQRGFPVDEPGNKISAHRGSTGELLWENKYNYSGPVSLHDTMIIPGKPGEKVLTPLTGEPFLAENPFTGETYPWTYYRTYGCGTMNSSRYLITFRSGAAGFNDLLHFGGTGNFGGFKAGCTNNLVAADGVLNAPDYTRTCTCSYQLQTSLALIHNPESEMWTLNHRLSKGKNAVKNLGINFGAPGNRREQDILWLEFPKVYAPGPDTEITIQPSNPVWFRNHASWIKNPEQGHSWVGSYGAEGIEEVRIPLLPKESSPLLYKVTFYFVEPKEIEAGKRVFDLYMQGKKVLSDIDIVKATGGSRRILKSLIESISVEEDLIIRFSPKAGSLPPVISGIEITIQTP
jgi:outer membrane protein assembly factor BamB